MAKTVTVMKPLKDNDLCILRHRKDTCGYHAKHLVVTPGSSILVCSFHLVETVNQLTER